MNSVLFLGPKQIKWKGPIVVPNEVTRLIQWPVFFQVAPVLHCLTKVRFDVLTPLMRLNDQCSPVRRRTGWCATWRRCARPTSSRTPTPTRSGTWRCSRAARTTTTPPLATTCPSTWRSTAVRRVRSALGSAPLYSLGQIYARKDFPHGWSIQSYLHGQGTDLRDTDWLLQRFTDRALLNKKLFFYARRWWPPTSSRWSPQPGTHSTRSAKNRRVSSKANAGVSPR